MNVPAPFAAPSAKKKKKRIVIFTSPKYNYFNSFHMLGSSYTFPSLSKTNVICPSKLILNLKKILNFI